MTSLKPLPKAEVITWKVLVERHQGDPFALEHLVSHRLGSTEWWATPAPNVMKRELARKPAELWLATAEKSVSNPSHYCLKVNQLPAMPLLVTRDEVPPRALWLWDGKAYETRDIELNSADVLALVNMAANKRRLQLQKAHALQDMTQAIDDSKLRKPIPREVKLEVWQRDGGRCVECGSQKDLEYDHVIPLALGGSNTARNLQLLCASCNNRKGASLG